MELVEMMAAALPFCVLLVWILVLYQAERVESLREAFIYAAVGWGAYTVFITELLSLGASIGFSSLLLCWLIPIAAGLGWLVLRWRQGKGFRNPGRVRLQGWPAVLAGICALFVLTTAVLARLSPPNNWDALNYHMARVAHWAQLGSIHHYATGIEVQNYMPPGNAIFMLQLYVLGRGDAWVNFVQWFAMLGSLLAASEVVRRLGGSPRAQWFAAVFIATLPMGIMQASSATSDYFLAFWLVLVAALVVMLWQQPQAAWRLVPLGVASGLAVLSKQTSLPFLLPFALWSLAAIFQERPGRKTITAALAGLALIVLLNTGYLYRNYRTYGSPAGPQYRVELHVNQPIGVRSFISSLVKNAALHAGTPSPYANKAAALVVQGVHQLLGLELDAPGLTAEGQFRIKGQVHHETVAGNLVQAVLILLAAGVFAWNRSGWRRPERLYGLSVLMGFLLFVLIFKWKITGSRYHLPFFVLAGPAVAMLVDRWKSWKLAFVTAALGLWALPYLVANQARPLISGADSTFVGSVLTTPRRDLYFANGEYLERPYVEMTSMIRSDACEAVGISLPGAAAEYPLWALLGAPDPALRMEWIVSGTPSAGYLQPDFSPCAVICDSCPEEWETVRGLPLVYDRSPFRLYLGRPEAGE